MLYTHYTITYSYYYYFCLIIAIHLMLYIIPIFVLGTYVCNQNSYCKYIDLESLVFIV
jgi:hypothetical protein